MSNYLFNALCCCEEPSELQACCFENFDCDDLEPQLCTDMGGTPQGVGTECTNVDCGPFEPCTECQCHGGPGTALTTWSDFNAECCDGGGFGTLLMSIFHGGLIGCGDDELGKGETPTGCHWGPSTTQNFPTGCFAGGGTEFEWRVVEVELFPDFENTGLSFWQVTILFRLPFIGTNGVRYIRPCLGLGDISPVGNYAFHSFNFPGALGCEDVVNEGTVTIT